MENTAIEMKIIVKSEIGIPVNPHEKYLYGSGELSQTWAYFERSIATHPAPGLADGEYESDLVWQCEYDWNRGQWITVSNEWYEDMKDATANNYRQIWRISPSDFVNKGKDWTGVGEQVLKSMEGVKEAAIAFAGIPTGGTKSSGHLWAERAFEAGANWHSGRLSQKVEELREALLLAKTELEQFIPVTDVKVLDVIDSALK